MAARDFPRFRDLPTELRLQIWSHCIPGPRVVEMDFPVSNQHLTLPAGPHRALWSPPVGRVPLVSRVCREARSVTRNHVQYVTTDEEQTDEDGTECPHEYQSDWGVDAPVRLRKGFDIVHLNWHYGYERVDMCNPAQYPWATFQWLANQAAAASVSADLLLQFDPVRRNPYTSSTDFYEEEMRYFDPRRLHYAVLAIVEIHISAEEAAQAGVFGVLGEEPIKLVDPRDTATIAKFRDVWRRRQSGSPLDKEPDVAEFFSTTVDAADAYCARVERWRRGLERKWLWRKGSELGIPSATRIEIWPDRGADRGKEDSDGNEVEVPHGWRVTWNRRGLIRDHPWVQTQLALMPRFEPALMFRHCVSSSGSCQKNARTFPSWLISAAPGVTA